MIIVCMIIVGASRKNLFDLRKPKTISTDRVGSRALVVIYEINIRLDIFMNRKKFWVNVSFLQ